jgi:type II secretory pathway pseudopilin PulG
MVEVMAALTLVAVAMAAVASVFWGALRTAGASSFRSAGAALATRETEAIHGIPYGKVGFYSTQPGYLATFESNSTVTLGTTAPAGALTPTDIHRVGPINYSVTRQLTWVDAKNAAGATLTGAYKKTTVIVTWKDDTGQHTTRQDSIFYPGGLAAYAGAGAGTSTTTTTTAVSGIPGTPTGLVATQVVAPDGETRMDLSWTAPSGGVAVNHYTIHTSTDSTFSAGVVAASSLTTSYRVVGLSPATLYYFRVFAVSTASPVETGASPASNVASNTTLIPPPAPCTVSSMSLTLPADGGASLGNGTNSDKIQENVQVTLLVNAECATTTFKAQIKTSPGNVAVGPPQTFAGTGTTRTAQWNTGTGGFSAGNYKIVLTDVNSVDWTPAKFVTLLVCTKNAPCP